MCTPSDGSASMKNGRAPVSAFRPFNATQVV
jgi:hypothetical protein